MITKFRQLSVLFLILPSLLSHPLFAAPPASATLPDTSSLQQLSTNGHDSTTTGDSLIKLLREKKEQLQAIEKEVTINAEKLQAKEQQLVSIDAKLMRIKQVAYALAAVFLLLICMGLIIVFGKRKKTPLKTD
ncbi:MAG: hypothetical protein ONB16_01815 [candidate division KSB1 bacterium]|nr:hypothetical protein [candidate division KSB1 bacterium]MDZ7317580.1 hypothetical protein [candidate division KSB1 bacterium]MDZ7340187.1 hypothetical protein [candidate division KSB1 bacterium]